MNKHTSVLLILITSFLFVSCQNKNIKRDKGGNRPVEETSSDTKENSLEEKAKKEEAERIAKEKKDYPVGVDKVLKQKVAEGTTLSFGKTFKLEAMTDKTKRFILNKNMGQDPTPNGMCTITHRVRNRDVRVAPKRNFKVERVETGVFDGGLTTEIQIEFASNNFMLENMVCVFIGPDVKLKGPAINSLQAIFTASAENHYYKSYKSGCRALKKADSQAYYDFCY